MYKAYKRFMKGFTKVEEISMVIVLAAVTLITFGNVLSRYLLPTSWSFTEEIVINLFAVMSMIGAAMLASKDGGLVSMALLNNALSDKGKHILNLIDVVLGILFFVVILVYGIQRMQSSMAVNQQTDVLRMPMWVFYFFSMVVGSICFFLHYLEFALDNIHALIHGEPTDEKTELAGQKEEAK